MTNLPIASNSLPSSGNAQNAALANGTADDAQAAAGAAPFAALLAQQIGGAEAALLNLAQISIGGKTGSGNVAPDLKETQDPAAIAADAATTMLMQIPQEQRTPTVADGATDNTATAAVGKTVTARTGSGLVASDVRNGLTQGIPNPAPGKPGMTGKTDAAATLPAAQQATIPELQTGDFAKQVELTASQSASPAPVAAAQLHASAVHAAFTPNIAQGNPAGENPQAITTPVGSHGWADEFSQKISWMSTQQNQVAELHLNPPDLGPLDVVLKITDNQATALFTSPHGAVREAVESALPKLRETLADNGITLGNATVSDQAPRDRDAESPRGQVAGTSNQRDGGNAEPGRLATASAQQNVVRRHNGMVDTFA